MRETNEFQQKNVVFFFFGGFLSERGGVLWTSNLTNPESSKLNGPQLWDLALPITPFGYAW